MVRGRCRFRSADWRPGVMFRSRTAYLSWRTYFNNVCRRSEDWDAPPLSKLLDAKTLRGRDESRHPPAPELRHLPPNFRIWRRSSRTVSLVRSEERRVGKEG